MKSEKKKALLIAFIVSLILLVIAVAGTLLFDYYMEAIEFDLVGMIIGHILGFLLLFAIIYKYEMKDDTTTDEVENHNIY